MNEGKVFLFILLVLSSLFLVFPSQSQWATASAQGITPYWLKPGTYLEYYANATQNHTYGVAISYSYRGCPIIIRGQQVQVIFTVANVSDGWVYIKARVTVMGSNYLLKLVKSGKVKVPIQLAYVATVFQGNNPEFRFPSTWGKHVMVRNATLGNEKKIKVEYWKNITISGSYKVNIATGKVYSLNGTYYGHTVLWGWRTGEEANETVAWSGNAPLRIKKLETINTTVLTYMGEFHGPNVLVITNTVTVPPLAVVSLLIWYNPGKELTLSFMGVVPDLEAIGLKAVGAVDNSAIKYTTEHLKQIKSATWAMGIVLKKMNVRASSVTCGKRPSGSRGWIVLAAALSALMAVVIWRVWYGRRKK